MQPNYLINTELKIKTFEAELSPQAKDQIRFEIKKLSKINPLFSFFCIVFDWIIIIASIYAAVSIDNFFISFLAIIIIGSRQHALLLLMHDAAHFRLTKNQQLNDLTSDMFCAYTLFLTTKNYRKSHLEHHLHLNSDLDPDWAPRYNKYEWHFPKPKKKLAWLLFQQLSGLNSFHILEKIYKYGLENKNVHTGPKKKKSQYLFRFLYYVVFFGVITYLNIWKFYAIYWILPAFTILSFLLRIRSISEHFALNYSHELTSSRNVTPNIFERFFIAPHNGHFHLDHHLYPSVPFHNLKSLHKILNTFSIYRNIAKINSSYLFPIQNSVLVDLIRPQQPHTTTSRASKRVEL